MTARVRPFQSRDQAQIAPLVLQIQREEFGIPVTAEEQPDLRDIQQHYLSAGGHFWVAEAEDAVVGTLGLLNIGHGDLALRKMFVAPAYRGRAHGVGAALLAAAVAWACEHQFQRILLGTTEQFRAAHRFYEKHGFTVIPVDALPGHFPRMRLDTRFYSRNLLNRSVGDSDSEWDAVAGGWKQWWPVIESAAHPVSQRMLDLAGITTGQRVLDIATGIGEPALLAAQRVGPSGRVIATDLSTRMLDIARERAATQGLTNVEFTAVDADHLPAQHGPFSAVLCRWGVTSLPNPPKVLSAVRQLLAPHGAFVTAIWEHGDKARPLASIAMRVAHELFGTLLLAEEPGASAAENLAQEMRDAGFTRVMTEPMRLTLTFAAPEDCARYLAEVSPDVVALLRDRSPAQQAEYRRRVSDGVQLFVSPDGHVRIPNLTVCAAGWR